MRTLGQKIYGDDWLDPDAKGAEAGLPPHDKRDQLDRITAGLLDGETLHGVYDAKGVGTGFIGLTDRRVIIQDDSFAGKVSALVSIPYRQVTSVGYKSNRSMLGKAVSTSGVVFTTADKQYAMDFRTDVTGRRVHDAVLRYIL